MTYPKRGEIYLYNEVEAFELDDCPFYRVKIEGNSYPVQTSHITREELERNCPAWLETKWRYSHTTNESIPIFNFVGTDEERDSIVDFKEVPDDFENGACFWVTPKSSPRLHHLDIDY